MKKFRTLDLAIQFYEQVEGLELKGNLRDQMERAASSISLNLSEGNAKNTVKDKLRFFQMAYGSLRESQTILKLSKVEDPKILHTADRLGACLYKLLKSDIKTFQ